MIKLEPSSPLSPGSPPLREISPDVILPKGQELKPGDRFPAKTSKGDRQCTNCSETDTPQWRGTLCNACALWKRSRGTDRPLPLLFPPRKRSRSPTPNSDEDDGLADTGPLSLSPMRHIGSCRDCRRHGVVLAHPTRMPLCPMCLHLRVSLTNSGVRAITDWQRQNALSPFSSPATPRFPCPPSALQHHLKQRYHDRSPNRPSSEISSKDTPTTYTIATPQTGLAGLSLATPPSGPSREASRNDHHSTKLGLPAEKQTQGRRRAATVSGNGNADFRAHPDATVHLKEQVNSDHRSRLSPSPEGSDSESQCQMEPRLPTRRRSTISGYAEDDEALPPAQDFMAAAEKLWTVLKSSELLLEGLDHSGEV